MKCGHCEVIVKFNKLQLSDFKNSNNYFSNSSNYFKNRSNYSITIFRITINFRDSFTVLLLQNVLLGQSKLISSSFEKPIININSYDNPELISGYNYFRTGCFATVIIVYISSSTYNKRGWFSVCVTYHTIAGKAIILNFIISSYQKGVASGPWGACDSPFVR